MCYLNSVQLIGNLGKDPEKVESAKNKDSQKSIFVKMNVATNKKYKNAKGEVVKDTQWHTVYLNNKTANFALDYLNIGDKVLIIGELRTNRWKDKEGVERFSTAIYARECRAFFDKTRTDEAEAEDQAAVEAAEAVEPFDGNTQDDIPF